MSFPYRLYLVTSAKDYSNFSFESLLKATIDGGVDCIQLREKNISDRDYLNKALQAKKICHQYNIALFINDNLDVAIHSLANGIHLGQEDIKNQYAMNTFPSTLQIGLTIDDISQIEALNLFDISYLGVSSLFKSKTKVNQKNIWTKEDIKTLKTKTKHPLIGIGGINENNIEKVMQYELNGIAISNAICQQSSLAQVYKTTKFFRRYCDEL